MTTGLCGHVRVRIFFQLPFELVRSEFEVSVINKFLEMNFPIFYIKKQMKRDKTSTWFVTFAFKNQK